MDGGVAIWWLSEADYEVIGDPPITGWPAYLLRQYESRRGRPGRGRLWVDQEIEAEHGPLRVDWPRTLLGVVLERCGGLVVRIEDVPLLDDLPGYVTDTTLKRFRAA